MADSLETIIGQIVKKVLQNDVTYNNIESSEAQKRQMENEVKEETQRSIDNTVKVLSKSLPADVSLPIGIELKVAISLLEEVKNNPNAIREVYKRSTEELDRMVFSNVQEKEAIIYNSVDRTENIEAIINGNLTLDLIQALAENGSVISEDSLEQISKKEIENGSCVNSYGMNVNLMNEGISKKEAIIAQKIYNLSSKSMPEYMKQGNFQAIKKMSETLEEGIDAVIDYILENQKLLLQIENAKAFKELIGIMSTSRKENKANWQQGSYTHIQDIGIIQIIMQKMPSDYPDRDWFVKKIQDMNPDAYKTYEENSELINQMDFSDIDSIQKLHFDVYRDANPRSVEEIKQVLKDKINVAKAVKEGNIEFVREFCKDKEYGINLAIRSVLDENDNGGNIEELQDLIIAIMEERRALGNEWQKDSTTAARDVDTVKMIWKIADKKPELVTLIQELMPQALEFVQQHEEFVFTKSYGYNDSTYWKYINNAPDDLKSQDSYDFYMKIQEKMVQEYYDDNPRLKRKKEEELEKIELIKEKDDDSFKEFVMLHQGETLSSSEMLRRYQEFLQSRDNRKIEAPIREKKILTREEKEENLKASMNKMAEVKGVAFALKTVSTMMMKKEPQERELISGVVAEMLSQEQFMSHAKTEDIPVIRGLINNCLDEENKKKNGQLVDYVQALGGAIKDINDRDKLKPEEMMVEDTPEQKRSIIEFDDGPEL